MKCYFCPNEAFAIVKTQLGIDVEREHPVCKQCFKQMKGWEIVRKL